MTRKISLFERGYEDAYLAGLFDGEGCIYIGHPGKADNLPDGKYQLVVTLSNGHQGIIQNVQTAFGGFLQIQHVHDGRRHLGYTLHLRSRKAANFLRSVLPYLKIKRAEAILALEFQDHMSERCPITPDVMEYRQGCMEQMKALKTAYRHTVLDDLQPKDTDESTESKPSR